MGCRHSKEPRRDGWAKVRPIHYTPTLQNSPNPGSASQKEEKELPLAPPDISITRDTLMTAFSNMARYLCSQGVHYRVVAVGGAVDTIYLRSRDTTHEVDFFCVSDDIVLLREAAKYAQQQSAYHPGTSWPNTTTTLFIGALQTVLIEEARAQNTIIFQNPGLTVLAPPWSYALCGKADRIGRRDEQPYDCADAVTYVEQYIALHGGPLPVTTVARWAQDYGRMITRCTLTQIDEMYRHVFGKDGIHFD